MRMRRRNNLEPRMAACESVWIHDPEARHGHWRELMPEARELRVELGCGKGRFTAGSAAVEMVPDAMVVAMERCAALPKLHFSGIFQHFAVADSDAPDDLAYTEEQYDLFTRVVDRLQADGYATGTVHCANSAAQLRHPEWRRDMTRAGIILYGLDPSEDAHFPELQPALSLHCIVTFVKELQPGQCVSYGRTFTADHPMRVATVCVGYADGYPRALSGGQGQGVMSIHGRPAPVVGRVCMDQTLVDVTNIPEVKMGDEVVVFGPGAEDTADTIVKKTNTINYEIVCGLARRVPRVYKENGTVCKIWNDLEET